MPSTPISSPTSAECVNHVKSRSAVAPICPRCVERSTTAAYLLRRALGSELIYGGSFDESCRRINEMLMLAKVDKFEPERLA